MWIAGTLLVLESLSPENQLVLGILESQDHLSPGYRPFPRPFKSQESMSPSIPSTIQVDDI